MEDQAFAVMETLMEGGFSWKPPADVDPDETQLNSLRAAGLTFSRVSATVTSPPVEDLLVPIEAPLEDQLVPIESPVEDQLVPIELD